MKKIDEKNFGSSLEHAKCVLHGIGRQMEMKRPKKMSVNISKALHCRTVEKRCPATD